MSLVEHLTELRRRLIISVVALAVGGLVAFLLYERILDFLISPYEEVTGKTTLVITDPLEGFATRLKISAYGGFFLASPVVLWQIWRFITPGLHKKEKRYAVPFILASIVLFLCGVGVAFLTFEPALRFLVGVGGNDLETFFTPSKYLSLITLMIVAFGIAFEFPILLVFLQLAGVVPSRRLRKWRRPAVVIIVGVAALITPSGDPYSLFAMAAPMYLFYEGAILVGRLLKK
ncbi:MAG TPA: twin-arginine translocase subunit TatC [Acidimicrobiales bacterium]|nr:twin-arginine translocase subunit TatC [Acidimicrobiales bacterium]